jgi:hypothetical protein
MACKIEGSHAWACGPPIKHARVEIVIMAGNARPDTVNFSEPNSRGGCSTENEKQKTENGKLLEPG